MSSRYYPESDGGGHWTGTYWSHQPTTYYVANDEDPNFRHECESWAEARRIAAELNALLTPRFVVQAYNTGMGWINTRLDAATLDKAKELEHQLRADPSRWINNTVGQTRILDRKTLQAADAQVG